jgi:hypothetical protein
MLHVLFRYPLWYRAHDVKLFFPTIKCMLLPRRPGLGTALSRLAIQVRSGGILQCGFLFGQIGLVEKRLFSSGRVAE